LSSTYDGYTLTEIQMLKQPIITRDEFFEIISSSFNLPDRKCFSGWV